MLDYLIVGAGITGVSVARLLQQHQQGNFLILEAESEPGGLCRTKQIGQHHLDIGGGHFLCTKYQEVYDFIFAHIPESEFNFFPRVSKIEVENEVIDYPIEANLWQLPLEKQADYLISALASGEINQKQEPENYSDWIRWKLGEQIANSYMLPYNKKIWGVDPQEMDIDWLHKIPRLNPKEILLSCLQQRSNTEKFPSHAGFFYPKAGGFQTIFDAIYKKIAAQTVLAQPVIKLEQTPQGWLVNDRYEARTVINTAPWNHLYKALGSPSALEPAFSKLRANSIVVSLWEQDYQHDWHWNYVPDLAVRHHREFYIHNFAPHSQANGIYTETNYLRWQAQVGATRFTGQPLYEHINQVAYPIPTLGHATAIQTILDFYREKNLLGVGRWGQWQYFNSDVCIWEAMKFVKQLLNLSQP